MQKLEAEALGAHQCLYSHEGLSVIHTLFAPHSLIPAHEHRNLALVAPTFGGMTDVGCQVEAWTIAYDPEPMSEPARVGGSGMRALVLDCGADWLEEHGLGRMPLKIPTLNSSIEVRFALIRLQSALLVDCSIDVDTASLELLALLVENESGREPSRIVRRVMESIVEGATPGHNLKRLAQDVGFHPTYLARIFRRETGMPISDFIQRVRLCRAAGLMEQGDFCLGQIAMESGFWDHAHFTRTFKKAFGITPRQLQQVANVQARPGFVHHH